MISDSKFANYLTKRLSLLQNSTTKDEKALSKLSSLQSSLSIFESAGKNIADIDYETIAKSLTEGDLSGIDNLETKSIASVLSEVLSVEDVADNTGMLDDDVIDAAEIEEFIKELAAGDGDSLNLTMQDIDALFEKMGIDLDKVAEDAVDVALEEAIKETQEDLQKDTEDIKNTQKADSAKNASQTGSVGGSSGGGGVSTPKKTESLDKTDTTSSKTPEGVVEIEKQIEEKEGKISDIEAEAEKQIAEQQQAQQEAMKKAGISDEKIKEFQQQAEQKETEIKDTEKEISEKENQIVDYNSTITSNKNYLSALDAQISANEAQLDSIGDEDVNADGKRSQINSNLSNLKAEKERIEKENEKTEKNIEKAEKKKKELEENKEKLISEKQEILKNTLGDSSIPLLGVPTDAVNQVSASMKNSLISNYDEKIAEIKAQKETKVSKLRNEIQDLQVQLKDAKEAEKRESLINDNSPVIGAGISGEEFVDNLRQIIAENGETHGQCARGVRLAVEATYGIKYAPASGCDWDTYMEDMCARGIFEEATDAYPTSADLANLPAGAVVCWEASNLDDSPASKYGHACIADGKGGEYSDHYEQYIYKSVGGRSDTYRVFIVKE